MILLLLHDLPNRKKKVESLVKNKIRSGELTEELVKNCFKKHSTFIKSESVFGSVLDLAQMLMGHVEPALSLFSSTLFIQVSYKLKNMVNGWKESHLLKCKRGADTRCGLLL